MSNQLPAEVVAEILSRLSVKDLVRFRCVSKSFRSQIDSREFFKHHLDQSLKDNTNFRLLAVSPICGDDRIISSDFDSLENHFVLKNPLKAKNEYRPVYTIGGCNGLLCIAGEMFSFKMLNSIALVNCATRKYHTLPILKEEELFNDSERSTITHSTFGGFDYDASSDDYKVVRKASFKNIPMGLAGTHFLVYSLKKNAWTKAREFCPYCLRSVNRSAFVCGIMHSLVDMDSYMTGSSATNKIFGFDLVTEKNNEVPLPDCLLSTNIYLNVTVFGGCLCVVSNFDGAESEDIWVMKEYGVKESWTKLFSIAPYQSQKTYPELLPIAYSKNGDRVLVEIIRYRSGCHESFWYDPKKKMKRFLEEREKLPAWFSPVVMVESLASLKIVHEGKDPRKMKEHSRGRSRKRAYV